MKKLYSAFLLLITLSVGNLFGQCMLYPVSLADKVNNSSLIIEGKVISSKPFWDTNQKFIFKSNLVEVKQVLKGMLMTSRIEIITMGGELDGRVVTIEPSLQLNENESGIFMLYPYEQKDQFGYATYQVYSDQQGFFKFNLFENSALVPFVKYNNINIDLYPQLESLLGTKITPYVNSTISTNSGGSGKFGGPSSINAITGISPTTISAGTNSILTITGTGFGAGPANANLYVDFLNADDGGTTRITPHASQYVSWTNTQIQVKVPTRTFSASVQTSGTAGTGPVRVVSVGNFTHTSAVLTINYGELNNYNIPTASIFQSRFVELNGQGGFTWAFNNNFNSNAPAKAAFTRAINTWRCNTNINWSVGVATTSIVTPYPAASDNVNNIRFEIGNELPAGVLGLCAGFGAYCTSGPNTYYFIPEIDVYVDNATNWNYGPAATSGGQIDFESVWLHELGHGHQLSHVINTSDVMHWNIGPNTDKRTLLATNITAGNDVMSRSTAPGVCGYNPMVLVPAGSCSMTIPTASFNVTSPLCVNQVLTLTDLSTGGATNYTWTMTGGTPASANTKNTSTSYGTSGIKTISLIVANGLGTSSILSKTVSVIAGPVISVSSASTCAGSAVTLTASGSSTSYTWSPGSLIGASQLLNPANTTVYSVTGSNGTCTGVGVGTVSVTLLPNMNTTNGVICAGTSTILPVNGATNYTWMPGNLTGSSPLLSPSSNTTYTITGETNGCTNTKTVSVTVNPCTSLATRDGEISMSVFPNPTKGNITIQTSALFNGEISIVNALGQIIITKKVDSKNTIDVDLSEQANGIYILKLRTQNGAEKTMKLIKE